MWLFRPVLTLLNNAANGLVRRVGVEPVDEVAIEQNPDDLRQLVLHSAETGDLDARSSEQLSGALETSQATLDDLTSSSSLVGVPDGATVADVQRQARESGHLRILVGPADDPRGVVHVRDTLTAAADEPVAAYVRDLHELDGDVSVLDAMTTLRAAGTQIAVVHRADGGSTVVTLADLLSRMMPAAAGAERTAGRTAER
jgi:CBS domain containing-hemolysin-like protein